MTVTATDIQNVFDEFASYSLVRIEDAIAQMEVLITTKFLDDFRDRLIRLGTAHILTLWERDRLKTQSMVGQAQRGKQAKIDFSSLNYWQQTAYGQSFWQLLESVGGVGAITV